MSWRSFPISCWVLTPCWISLNTRSKSRSRRRTPRPSIGLCKVSPPPCRKTGFIASSSESHDRGLIRGSVATVQAGAAAAAAEHARRVGAGSYLHGSGAGQRRTDLVALYHRQVWAEFSVSPFARLPASVPRHLRNRPLHVAHGREHISRIYSLAPDLRLLALDSYDAVFPLVRRFRRRRRNVTGGAHEFPRGLDSPRADAFLGLSLHVRVSIGNPAEQSDLPTGGNVHVGSGAADFGRPRLGQRQRRSATCVASFCQRPFHSALADAAPLGSDRRHQIADRDHFRRPGRLLDAFLFLLDPRQGLRNGPLHGAAHRPDHGQGRGDSGLG